MDYLPFSHDITILPQIPDHSMIQSSMKQSAIPQTKQSIYTGTRHHPYLNNQSTTSWISHEQPFYLPDLIDSVLTMQHFTTTSHHQDSLGYNYTDYIYPTYINNPGYFSSNNQFATRYPSQIGNITQQNHFSKYVPTQIPSGQSNDELLKNPLLSQKNEIINGGNSEIVNPLFMTSGCAHQCTTCHQLYSSQNIIEHVKLCGSKYKCEYCFKLFSSAVTLRVHKRMHTGVKPYKCSYCGKDFSDNSTKTKHQRIHTKNKPYQCKICKTSFTQSGNLRRHIKNIHKLVCS